MLPPRPQRGLRLIAAVLLCAALVLPATPAAAVPTSDADVNHRAVSHDVTFIAMLVPHHQMAVQMASMARDKATNPQVRQLAAHIADGQSGQIRQMQAWLDRRGAKPMPPPAPVRAMEKQNMAMLRSARGVQVDRMFLIMMRPHHALAVAESVDELEHGRAKFALDQARTAKADQSRELARMNALLAALGQA